MTTSADSPRRLARRLGTADAVVIGLGSMIGAGVFAAFAPAASAAGSGLLVGLVIAALVAYCNATSSARLAARYPESGGTYVYGRRRLGDFWGYLAGWGFVVGKVASCAAMALTVGSYVDPRATRPLAVATVLGLTALNYLGVRKAAWLTRLIVAVTLAALAVVVMSALTAGHDRVALLTPFPGGGPYGILQAAGLLFFAFAGYARIATLGEEVRDPTQTIPRAIRLALAVTLAVYAAVALAALLTLGPHGLASSPAPLLSAVRQGRLGTLAPLVQVGAALAALGSLLALLLGVSRTVFAMARDRHLPGVLDTVHPRHRVPHRAELTVGLIVAALAATVDLRNAIGFSSFSVLAYYAIANVAAGTLTRAENRPPRWVPVVGAAGCLALAGSLPLTSVGVGALTLAVGAALWVARRLLWPSRKQVPSKR